MSDLLLLGKYQLAERLGPQGSIETYSALMKVSGGQQPCVVKWLRAEGVPAEAYRVAAARFLAAGRRLLDHHDPSWPVVFDVTENEKGAFLVREFVAGIDLHGLLQTARENNGGASIALDPSIGGLVASKLARVLAKAHGTNPPMCHLGLGPSNVLVTPKGDVIVTDFGLSASLRGLVDNSVARWAFVAPELIGADTEDLPSVAGVAADLYSLGSLLFYLLSGRPPVEGSSLTELTERAWEPLPALPGLPEHLNAAISTLTAPDPQSRCKSADEAVGLFSAATSNTNPVRKEPLAPAHAQEGTHPVAAQPSPPRPAQPRPHRPSKAARPRSPGMAVLLAGCLMLMFGGAVLLFHSVHVRRSEVTPVRARGLRPSIEIPVQSFDASPPEPARPYTVVPAPKRTLPRIPGRLSMTTTPEGADLWLDGVWQGKTPLDVTPGPGGHRVAVIAAGYRIFREVYDTTDGDIVTRELVPIDPPARGDAFLNIDCKTTAKFPIVVDNQETGLLCPVKMLPVSAGRHQVGIFVPAQRGTTTQEVTTVSGPKPIALHFRD